MDKLNDTPGTDSEPKVKLNFAEQFERFRYETNNNPKQLILEVERLLEDKDMNVNAVTGDGKDALMFSMGTGSTELVNLLLSKGADPTRTCNLGWTAAHQATGIEYPEILEMLITAEKFNLESKDKDGRSPLLHAVYLKSTDDVELFLKHGADIYSKYNHGKTAFDLAKGNEKMLELLNKYKVDKGI